MDEDRLPDSAFLVLAVLAERPHHGYELQRVVYGRGFRFWTQLRRSASYKALGILERADLVTGRTEPSNGPQRKVYRITDRGVDRLRVEALRKLAEPAHPHSEIDLAIYALPFLPEGEVITALRRCLDHLRAREDFLRERLDWCTTRGLRVPGLAFERPLVALRAEVAWLEGLLADQLAGARTDAGDWGHYVYREPPETGRAD